MAGSRPVPPRGEPSTAAPDAEREGAPRGESWEMPAAAGQRAGEDGPPPPDGGGGRRVAERQPPVADGSRSRRRFEPVRRPADLLLALTSLGALAALLGLAHALPVGSKALSEGVAGWFRHVPQGLTFAISLIVSIAALALVVTMVGALIRREARGALNAGVAAALGVAAAFVATTVWRSEHGVVGHLVLAGRNPSTFIVDATFFAVLAATDLVRRPRWSRWCIIVAGLLLLGDLAVGALAPLGAVVVLLGGTACGWLVRWVFGAASLRPTLGELTVQLAEHGIPVRELAPAPGLPRAALRGVLQGGESIEVRFANRDTRGAGAVRAFWARIRLRPIVSGHPPISSRAELERLALSGYVAADAAVEAPRTLLLTELSGESLVLVLGRPEGSVLSSSAPPKAAVAAFSALRAVHERGLAHRALRAEHLVVARDGSVGFVSLDQALPGASELVRRLDVTQLLLTLAGCFGSQVAVQAMREGYAPADEEAIVAILQPIALAPWGWTAMREARGAIGELREELARHQEGVPAERLERFRWRTVASAVALTLAAYILVGQISSVNLFGAIGRMDVGWFALAVFASAVTYLAAAANLAAFVPAKPTLLRGFLVQLSSAFVGVAMPPTVGHVAVNARYLHRRGVSEAAIAAAVALSQIANVLTSLLLLLVIGLLTGSGISKFHIVPSTGVLVALAVVVALVGVLLLIPPTRSLITHRVWPRLYSVWPRLLEALSEPVRLVASMAADLLLIGAYAVAFIASIHAMGGHAPVLLAVAVYLAGNAVGAAAPTPGGLGAVETVLAAGLTGIGVPPREAIPAVLVFRLATFWMPIPAGWLTFVYCQRKGIL